MNRTEEIIQRSSDGPTVIERDNSSGWGAAIVVVALLAVLGGAAYMLNGSVQNTAREQTMNDIKQSSTQQKQDETDMRQSATSYQQAATQAQQ
ncbi:MAG: hypothetical protein SFV17_02700 [Candidatus Obscuribacter sp.]|nr:hypothetical protein [Candidatus Obscuribacter sp.]